MTIRTEVPVADSNDLRAWDAMVETSLKTSSQRDRDSCAVEAETGLSDLQATDRRIALKMRDSGTERVILLVASSRRNRRILKDFHELVAARYPLGSRAVVAALRTGRCPERSGVLML
jgi:hypothetical protein